MMNTRDAFELASDNLESSDLSPHAGMKAAYTFTALVALAYGLIYGLADSDGLLDEDGSDED